MSYRLCFSIDVGTSMKENKWGSNKLLKILFRCPSQNLFQDNKGI